MPDTSHSVTPERRSMRRVPRITPHRVLATLLVAGFGTWKALETIHVEEIPADVLDWVTGVAIVI
jgi:hypothetical protein